MQAEFPTEANLKKPVKTAWVFSEIKNKVLVHRHIVNIIPQSHQGLPVTPRALRASVFCQLEFEIYLK